MGIKDTIGVLTGPTGEQATMRFLVDSGANYTRVPHDVWKTLDLVPKRMPSVTLADGTPVQRDVSECHLRLPEGDGHTSVILGEPDGEALLSTISDSWVASLSGFSEGFGSSAASLVGRHLRPRAARNPTRRP